MIYGKKSKAQKKKLPPGLLGSKGGSIDKDIGDLVGSIVKKSVRKGAPIVKKAAKKIDLKSLLGSGLEDELGSFVGNLVKHTMKKATPIAKKTLKDVDLHSLFGSGLEDEIGDLVGSIVKKGVKKGKPLVKRGVKEVFGGARMGGRKPKRPLSAWQKHVKSVAAQMKGSPFKDIIKAAKATY